VTTFPRAFGRYTLLASLGRGGMGEVYAASVAGGVGGIEKRCVVKTLHASGATDREAVARFLDEARLAVRLNQRNICPVFDVGVVDGQHYLAMELVRGRDLRTLGHRARDVGVVLDTGLSIHIVTEALEGLDYAHELTDEAGRPLHVVHRDVSPQNIMVSFDGDVKIIDFGLAASELKVEQTEANVVMGKVAYMPPEQVRGERADRSADVFAAAVVLYELITATRYYEGVAPLMLPSVVAGGTYRPARMASLDPELQQILGRALDSRRDRRTASAGALAEELRTWARRHRLIGDAAALRRLMREVFGAPRDVWESAAFTAQRNVIQPAMQVRSIATTVHDGFVDPDVPGGDDEDTDRRAALLTESAAVAVGDGHAPRHEATAATEIVRNGSSLVAGTPTTAVTPSHRVAVAAAVGLGILTLALGVAWVATPRARPTGTTAGSSSSAATVPIIAAAPSPASSGTAAATAELQEAMADSAPSEAAVATRTATAPSAASPPAGGAPSGLAAPVESAVPNAGPASLVTAPVAAPVRAAALDPPAPAPGPMRGRARPVDASAAALTRLDAVVDAAPLLQLKALRAECGANACAGVSLTDESTPARIRKCLLDCKQSVRQRGR
jgi:serine/threonine-protein kinase